MKVLFFSGSREASGVADADLEVAGNLSAREVWARLIRDYPNLAKFQSTSRLARNGAYADSETEFMNDDEVAIIPPVSGG